jgi:mannose-6-phosphate isomerase
MATLRIDIERNVMYRLLNTTQRYAWGSLTAIPEFLGVPSDGAPVAELWMGTHPTAPSVVVDPATGREESLRALIDTDPVGVIGPRVQALFGARLPFLLKVLAAAQPLSLQVHPNREQARRGFAREEAAGIGRDAAERSFRDDEHKPEMILALTRFEALSGFRDVARVLELLAGLPGGLAERLRGSLATEPEELAIRAAFELLVSLTPAERSALVPELVAACQHRIAMGSPFPRADEAVVGLATWYPGDPGAVASLLLNRVTLEPGEAMFVPAGALHTYLEGLGIEVMAASDNVLRAGLTTKHIDRVELLACTEFTPSPPARTAAEAVDAVVAVYRAPVDEFALALARLRRGAPGAALPGNGPRVLLCIDGAVDAASGAGRLSLARGESVFIRADDGAVRLTGAGTVLQAFVP